MSNEGRVFSVQVNLLIDRCLPSWSWELGVVVGSGVRSGDLGVRSWVLGVESWQLAIGVRLGLEHRTPNQERMPQIREFLTGYGDIG